MTEHIEEQLKELGMLKPYPTGKKLQAVWEGKECIGWKAYRTYGITFSWPSFFGYIWKEKQDV